MKRKKELFNYIQTTTGWTIENKKLSISLPLYIQTGYDLWNSSVAGFGVLFAFVKDKQIDMRIHYNAARKIEETCPCHVVLVFDFLDNQTITRLIKKHQSFVVQDKYIYMPFALMQAETAKNAQMANKKFQALTADADTVLVGYLNGTLTNGMMIKDISYHIERDMRATSAALSVLESFGYVELKKHGRSKMISFADREEVYGRFTNDVKSPIKYTFFTDSVVGLQHSCYSGYSALSRYSSLMDSPVPTIAISTKTRNALFSKTIECDKDQALYQVEVWDRNPGTFAIGDTVNPLYVMRILSNESDERTIIALEEMEEKFVKQWKGNE